ncbi:MAG: uridine kinase [Micromonosporaceae bacterium]
MEARGAGAREQLVERIARLVPERGQECVRVGVDGVDAAGKTTFADELASALRDQGRPVVRVRADDFLNVRAVRHRQGRDSPEGFWQDSYNYPALTAGVLTPFGPGGDRRYRGAAYHLGTDSTVDDPHRVAAPASVLVLDGLFLHRDELVGLWDFSVFLDVPFAITAARMAVRDGSHPDPDHPSIARYVQGQRIYLASCDPASRARVVVDNSDPARPELIQGPASGAQQRRGVTAGGGRGEEVRRVGIESAPHRGELHR